MAQGAGLRDEWLAQRGHLFPWVPVFLSVGIGLYFGLRFEPDAVLYAIGVALVCLLAVLGWRIPAAYSPVVWAILLIGVGFTMAGARAHQVAHPVLGWHYYGPVEGRIVGIDRSSSDAVRLTLDQVRLERISPGRTPERVRVSLHGPQGFAPIVPGQFVMMTAHLSPPGGPTEPGGFDFQRHSWFLGLGAVGYTRTPVLTRAPPDGSQAVFAARMWVSNRVQQALPGERGGFATAIMTGDRSALDQTSVEALRITNLAHLLAISGLHMGLLTAFVFSVFRLGFAALPAVGLRIPAKKVAAACALPVAAGYLILSGASVATERAFIMVAVALVAVMLDRRALSLRSVAAAAVIVLVMRPEALLGPGFQMSFAATTALVAVYDRLRGYRLPKGPRWLRPFTAVLLSSFVAGLATAPVAAAHFNQFAHYGLIANLLSVPLMGMLVMPAAVISALLMPFGMEGVALWVMGQGISWILGVAHWVAQLPGARGTVVAPGPAVLPLIACGALLVMLWRGHGRIAGLAPVAVGLLLWSQTERPAVLIADTGALVGVMTDEGRALSRAKGAGFVAQNWLENDGDPAAQDKAAARWQQLSPAAFPILQISGKRALSDVETCAKAQIIVFSIEPPADLVSRLNCTIHTPASLRHTGAVALVETRDGYRQITARQVTGTRLWNMSDVRKSRGGQ